MFNFNPSKMDPKTLMELSQLVQQLPPDRLAQMQSLTHNMMAGFDVRAEMEAFEKSLPPEFREKLMSIMAKNGGLPPSTPATSKPVIETDSVSSLREARMTILRALAEGRITPEEAETALFPN